MPHRQLATTLAVGLAACLVLTGCAGDQVPSTPPTASISSTSPSPDPSRPVVTLAYRFDDDLAEVSGKETVRFTPDREVCELIFRAWPNKPATARQGNALTVQTVTVQEHELSMSVEASGAPTGAPGTLVVAHLPSCMPAGSPVEATLAFTVTLGGPTDERMGRDRKGSQAWIATAFPLLAWVKGQGWTRDPAVAVDGEMATSDMFQLDDLSVTAPRAMQVGGTGALGAVEASQHGLTHHFSAPAVRDVAVVVGDELRVSHIDGAGTRIHLVLPAKSAATADAWSAAVTGSLRRLSELLGPYPFGDLWVHVIPDQSEGVEITGAVQMGDLRLRNDTWLVTHEVAHQWFYGLVGNNQARDPWLDEALATMAQRIADDPAGSPELQGSSDKARKRMGLPMSAFTADKNASSAYVNAVYIGGSDVLVAARDAAGHAAFDQALRGYVQRNAYRVATPGDFAQAFAGLPEVTRSLRTYVGISSAVSAVPSPPTPRTGR